MAAMVGTKTGIFNRARKGPESLVGEGPRRRRGTLTTTRNGRAREIYYSFIENRAFGGGYRENYVTEKPQSRVICQKHIGQSVRIGTGKHLFVATRLPGIEEWPSRGSSPLQPPNGLSTLHRAR